LQFKPKNVVDLQDPVAGGIPQRTARVECGKSVTPRAGTAAQEKGKGVGICRCEERSDEAISLMIKDKLVSSMKLLREDCLG